MDYQSYYSQQSGSGLPVFTGTRHQKGYGLGNLFRSFYRWCLPLFKTHALPLIKEGAQTLGSETIKTVANVANDALSGKNFEEAAKERTKEAVNSLANAAEARIQRGLGYKRKKKFKKNFNNKKIRTKQDIFDQL